MADLLGLDQQQAQEQTTTDYLGQKVPISFQNQPALPTSVGAPAAGVSTAPSTIAGTGSAPTPPGFGDLAGAAIPPQGPETGGGGPGVGEGGGGFAGQFGQPPSSFGFNVGIPGLPASVGIGPTGTLSGQVNTGIPVADSIINGAIGLLSGKAGIPTSVNLPSLVAMLTSSPVAAALATAAGAVGMPLAMASLSHSLAKGDPASVTNVLSNFQAAINDPEPAIAEEAANAQMEADAAATAAQSGQAFSFSSPMAAAIATAMGVPGISQSAQGYSIGPHSQLGQSPRPAAAPAFSDLASATMPDAASQAAIAEATAGTGVTSGGAAGEGPSGPGDAGDAGGVGDF